MAVNIETGSGYDDLFRTYIVRGAEAALVRLQEAGEARLADVRETALHCLNYALRVPAAEPLALAIILALAEHMERIGRRDDWAPSLIAGIRIARRRNDTAAKAALLFRLGRLYQWRSKFTAAETLFRHSAAAYAAAGHDEGHALALNRLGFLACLRHAYGEAEKLANAALALLGDDHPERADSFNVLGRIALFQQQWGSAKAHFEEALAIRQQQGDAYLIACNLRDVALAEWNAGRLEPARVSLERAIEIFIGNHIPAEEATARINLGIILRQLGKHDQAERQYKIAIELHLAQNDVLHAAIAYNNLGYLYMTLEHWVQAEAALHTSIRLRQPLGDGLYLADTLTTLAQVQLRQHDRQAAYDSIAAALHFLEPFPEHPLTSQLRLKIDAMLPLLGPC